MAEEITRGLQKFRALTWRCPFAAQGCFPQENPLLLRILIKINRIWWRRVHRPGSQSAWEPKAGDHSCAITQTLLASLGYYVTRSLNVKFREYQSLSQSSNSHLAHSLSSSSSVSRLLIDDDGWYYWLWNIRYCPHLPSFNPFSTSKGAYTWRLAQSPTTEQWLSLALPSRLQALNHWSLLPAPMLLKALPCSRSPWLKNHCQPMWWPAVPSSSAHSGWPALPISICHAILLPTCAFCPCGFPTLSTRSSTSSLFKLSRPTSLPFSSTELSAASPALSDLHLCCMSHSHLQSVLTRWAPTCVEHSKPLMSPFYVPGTVGRPERGTEMKRSSRIPPFLRGWLDRHADNHHTPKGT